MSAIDPEQAQHVLLVDANPVDATVLRRCVKMVAPATTLHLVADGAAAWSFLRKEELYHGAPDPDGIVLNLASSGKDGRALLARLKTDPVLRAIPVVVVFTAEGKEDDILWAYEWGANCCLIEPRSLEEVL